ncbi:MAG: insulinase family protein [Cyanobacteria bacterium SIG30]|nr:insulinase family protein [Cyanobacteria bacterium SIG30]
MIKEKIDYPYLEKPISLYTLDNGHKIAIAYKKGEMANISTWVKTGSINEDETNNGVSHFLEHLMFKGTKQFKPGEFDKILERKGGIINAATWKDYTFYYVTIEKKHIDLAIKMHADMMVDPTLSEEEIGPAFDPEGEAPEEKRERYVVIEEIKMGEDNDWRKVYEITNDAMYENHPYKRKVIGTKQIIATIPQKDIMSYYKTFYTPDNISTIVVGEFDNEEEILNKVIENFKFKTDKKAPIKKNELEIKMKKPKYVEKTSETNTGYIMFGFLTDTSKNLKESIALNLLVSILGGSRTSRLNSKYIEQVDEPHYNSIDTCYYQFREGNNFFIEANFDPKYKETVIEEIKAELKNLNEITEEELKRAKKRVLVEFVESAETVSDIADSIGHYLTVCEDLSYAKKYETTLENITKKYLEEIAQEYLNENNCAIGVVMPKGEN